MMTDNEEADLKKLLSANIAERITFCWVSPINESTWKNLLKSQQQHNYVCKVQKYCLYKNIWKYITWT